MSGNEIAEGLEKADWGTLAVNSSRILVKRENAGRTGYSWSVIKMAVIQSRSVSRDGQEMVTNQPTCKLFCPTTVEYMGCIIVLLHALTLSLCCSVDYGFAEER